MKDLRIGKFPSTKIPTRVLRLQNPTQNQGHWPLGPAPVTSGNPDRGYIRNSQHMRHGTMTGFKGQRENFLAEPTGALHVPGHSSPQASVKHGPHLPKLAGPGSGGVTAGESRWCHMSSWMGLSTHFHGRNRSGESRLVPAS